MREPHEVQQTLQPVRQAIAPRKARLVTTWIVDSGFDDVAVWRTLWEQEEHVLCRVKHTDRLVGYQARAAQWHDGAIA